MTRADPDQQQQLSFGNATYTEVHLAVRTETGYRPAIVIQDNGEGEPMVKVRCAIKGVVQDRWVYRVDLIPVRWIGPRRVTPSAHR